ncbi:MAG: 4-alpha-glucanotransferase [Acidobacteriota bacterium]|nr:4-alpha-glucanotransferase [Acidobacteriota bacterium]
MRKSGILLHPTSLPGEWGIGDLGKSAYRFVDFLLESGQHLWQILPLGPPGCGHSPYQCFSSMAGNPLLISLQALVEQDLLSPEDLRQKPDFPESTVDFAAVIPSKLRLIRKAAASFFEREAHPLREDFLEFCSRAQSWLDAYAAFAALKDANQGAAWTQWSQRGAARAEDVREHQFIQFEFFRQWKALKKYCKDRGIDIIGDLPIFVAHDSADVWANPGLFDLDADGNPRTIAGVPPDYFSETGQCWGNPLYRWDVMEQTGYRWWIERVKGMLEMVDIIRIDHFRGFEKYFEIPGDAKTAVNGRWVEGPGDRFFEVLQQALGKVPFIAEDLGYITPEVHALRDRWGFPGMRVLQFAFGDQSLENPHKPHNFVRNCVVYTGTHDNETTAGWFRQRTGEPARSEIELALRYMGTDGTDAVWDLIRLAVSSVADIAILPMQDVVGLGTEARMNIPSTVENNWRWRMTEEQMKSEVAGRLREMNYIYGRWRTS